MRYRILLGLALMAALLAPTAAHAAGGTKRSTLGRAITLHGFGRETLSVRPTELVDPLTPGEFDDVPAGRHLVGVRMSFRNAGGGTYRDSPRNGANLITSAGRSIEPTFASPDDCEQSSTLRVPAGQTRLSCLVFEVPDAARLRFFEFTLDSGFADE